MFAHHIVGHASFARVISWSHYERNSSTFESSISFYFFFFSFTFNFLHFSLHVYHNFEGSSNTTYFAWKKMDSNDDSYSFTG